MNSNVTRKIGFYSLKLVRRNDETELLNPLLLVELMEYINSLGKAGRKRDIAENKFYFLSDMENTSEDANIQTLVFKHAEHGRRPPLINKDTLDERENPKELPEGESEKVHIALRYFEDEIILLLEEMRSAITIKRLVYYLEELATAFYSSSNETLPYKIIYSTLVKDNFLEELSKLRRVSVGYISVSKQLLGSEFFNLSDRIEELKQDVVVEVRAEKNRSATGFIEDIFNKLTSSEQQISKIRVYGIDEENFGVTLDTDIIKKIKFLEFETDLLTGEIDTPTILNQLTSILMSL